MKIHTTKHKPTVLAIDTSCDETSAAVVCGRRVLSNVIYSSAILQKQYGGVMPSVAKRAHVERIDSVVNRALSKAGFSAEKLDSNGLDAIAVTQGPGLAIALEVGIAKAKELAGQFKLPLVSVNHMEGHVYSAFLQNRNGIPDRQITYPFLALLVSGGHTELVKVTGDLEYEIIGKTVDDAAGEALDKAARLLGFEYPGGPILEALAAEVENRQIFAFPKPLWQHSGLNFSYSGLKTALLYKYKELDEGAKVSDIRDLASSFQEAVFELLLRQLVKAVKTTGISQVVFGGGVAVNNRLRKLARQAGKVHKFNVVFPPFKYLNNDNAAMIGFVGCMKFSRNHIILPETLERVPRMSL